MYPQVLQLADDLGSGPIFEISETSLNRVDSADPSAALAAYINGLPPGSVGYFADGTYSLDSFAITNSVTLVGQSNGGTVLQQVGTAGNFITVNASNVRFENMTIEGNGTGSALMLDAGISHISLLQVKVTGSSVGMTTGAITDLSIDDCEFSGNSSATQCLIIPAAGTISSNISILNSDFDASAATIGGTSALFIDLAPSGGSSGSVSGVKISGNTIIAANYGTSEETDALVVITGATNQGSLSDVTISNNNLVSSRATISYGIETNAQNLALTGNTINGFTVGILLETNGSGNPVPYGTVAGNTVIGANTNTSFGIAMHAGDWTITGNFVRGAFYGIYADYADGAPTGTIVGNRIYVANSAGGGGIILNGVSDWVVNDNLLTPSAGTGGTIIGIELENTVSYLQVRNNYIGDIAYPIYNNGGTLSYSTFSGNTFDGDASTYTGISGTEVFVNVQSANIALFGNYIAASFVTAAGGQGDTITDAAGNNATLSTLSVTGLTQIGPQIDTTIPTVTSVVASTSSGVATLGDKLTLTLDLSEAVTVSGGIPTLSLNDGGKATYDAAESSATTLVFDYTVAAGQYAQTLAITGISLNGATIKDVVVGNVANLAGADSSITGLQVDATIPTVVADRSHDTLGGSLSEAATLGVLAHDTDADPSDILSVSAVDGLAGNVGIAVTGAYGTLTLNANGSYSYSNTNSAAVTAAGGVAVDVFTYTVSNGDGDTATSTLDIVITSSGQTYEAAAAGATLDGGTGSYVLDGGAGKDTLVAGKGTQVLIGGPGDTLTGAKGYSDMFVFAPGFGDDTITNFSTTSDTIQFSHLEFANFSAVLADARQMGNNVVITYDANDVITLTGVQLSQLHAADFHFA